MERLLQEDTVPDINCKQVSEDFSSAVCGSDIIMENIETGSGSTSDVITPREGSAHTGSSTSKGTNLKKHHEVLEKKMRKSVPPDKCKSSTSKEGSSKGSCESSPSKVSHMQIWTNSQLSLITLNHMTTDFMTFLFSLVSSP